MKYKLFFIFFIISSCASNMTKLENRSPYNSIGFAYIYNNEDLNNKIISGKLDNSKLEISHNQLKVGTQIKLINTKTNEALVLVNKKKISYPNFYKILISEMVANKLNLDKNLPLVEILEIKKNKSFVAKKTKIYNEEKKISSNAPVTSVQISNISKNKSEEKKNKEDFFILIGTFSSQEITEFLRKRIIKEIPQYDTKKLVVKKRNSKEIDLLSGPYKTINFMKNDYILLKKFGFEDLNITSNE